MRIGALEAGGTKMVCAVGRGGWEHFGADLHPHPQRPAENHTEDH